MFGDELIGIIQELGSEKDVYLRGIGDTTQCITDFELVIDEHGFIAITFEDD